MQSYGNIYSRDYNSGLPNLVESSNVPSFFFIKYSHLSLFYSFTHPIFRFSTEVVGDRNQYTFQKLPAFEPNDGSGSLFRVEVSAIVNTLADSEVVSSAVAAQFHTLPHKPSGLRVRFSVARSDSSNTDFNERALD